MLRHLQCHVCSLKSAKHGQTFGWNGTVITHQLMITLTTLGPPSSASAQAMLVTVIKLRW